MSEEGLEVGGWNVRVLVWYFKAKAKCVFLGIAVSNGLFFFVTALNECLCQGMTSFLLQSHLGVFSTLTSDTFSILWTPTCYKFILIFKCKTAEI